MKNGSTAIGMSLVRRAAAPPTPRADTRKADLIDKNREYRATPSIQRYVILQQTHRAAIIFLRREQNWLSEIVAGDNATLPLPEIGIEVPLDEIYANAGLPDELASYRKARIPAKSVSSFSQAARQTSQR